MRREGSEETNTAGTLILDLQLPKPGDRNSVCQATQSVGHFVMAVQADQYILRPSISKGSNSTVLKMGWGWHSKGTHWARARSQPKSQPHLPPCSSSCRLCDCVKVSSPPYVSVSLSVIWGDAVLCYLTDLFGFGYPLI